MIDEVEELRNLNLEKESLIARKNAIKAKLAEHRDEITDADNAEAKQIKSDLEKVEEKIKDAQERAKQNEKEEKRNYMENTNVDKRSSMEYRQAFMNFIQRNEKSDLLEKRADAVTTTATAATVIPTTVLNEIIRESKIQGNVLSKVRQLNVKGGVKIPTISAIPTATWIDEATVSDRKNLSTGAVTFSYYGLEVRIAQTLLSEYTSIDAFEAEFARLAVEAMVNAKEIAIFKGTGSGQPTGILNTTGVTSVTINAADFPKYTKLVEAFGKLPVDYRAGAELYVAQGTWDAIVGMVDNSGQPVARVNYGFNGIEQSFLGYPVNIVEEDRIKSFANGTASTDFFAVLGNLNYYALNSNGNLGVYKYRDEEKNQDVTKALEFVDGKVLQPKAFVVFKKGTAASAS